MYAFFKRTEDILVSVIVLLCMLPVILIVGVALRISGIKPVIFTQARAGKNGKTFKVYKFRSMLDTKDADGNLLPDEQRITPLGKFVRKTSLDEFPQMINVLKGDMSLVGPRPLLPEYNHMYSPKHRRRLDVVPGVTGYAAVNGRSAISFSKKFDLDVYYVEHASFLFDNLILFKTFFAVFAARGSTPTTNIGEVDDLGFVKRMLAERAEKRASERR